MCAVCLSTVDRRSRERFIESNTQIIALVEKFKLEGGPYRKSSAGGASHVVLGGDSGGHKLPYTNLGKPSGFQVGFTLYQWVYVDKNRFRRYIWFILYSRLPVSGGSRGSKH